MPDLPRYVVAQTGARRGYAVPAILERAEMLERFYTDVCGNAGWGGRLAMGAGLPGIGGSLHKLAGRHVPAEIIRKTRTFAGPNLRWWWNRLWTKKDAETAFRLHMRRILELGDLALKEGFGQATHLYMMYSEMPSLMIGARNQGLKVVAETYILQSTNRILREERALFPGWEEVMPDFDAISTEMAGEDVLFTRVDHHLCPSEAVRDDLVENWGVDRTQTLLVPYGVDPRWLGLEPQPRKGRILFVGTADLRKGIHYLAHASKLLQERGRRYEVRVAGHVSERVRARPECRHLHFLGRVPRDRIHEEFQQADVFVLPTLAEGSAEVTYEAMASALPLVTTASAGSVARHEAEALIVPERDGDALADALERVIENRALRHELAWAARVRAMDYTWEMYGHRLTEALTGLPAGPRVF